MPVWTLPQPLRSACHARLLPLRTRTQCLVALALVAAAAEHAATYLPWAGCAVVAGDEWCRQAARCGHAAEVDVPICPEAGGLVASRSKIGGNSSFPT